MTQSFMDRQPAIFEQMGTTELATNLFRITQTEEKLKRDKAKGKNNANKTYLEVGKKVKRTIKELRGAMPEDLLTTENIKAVECKMKDFEQKNI